MTALHGGGRHDLWRREVPEGGPGKTCLGIVLRVQPEFVQNPEHVLRQCPVVEI